MAYGYCCGYGIYSSHHALWFHQCGLKPRGFLPKARSTLQNGLGYLDERVPRRIEALFSLRNEARDYGSNRTQHEAFEEPLSLIYDARCRE